MKNTIKFDGRPVIESTFFVAAVMLGFFAMYAHYVQRSSWFWDCLFSIVLIIALYFLRKVMNISAVSAALVSLGIIFHNAGTFGFYASSPLFVEYDTFTHFFGLFACAFLFYGFLSYNESMSKGKLAFFVILACLGVGACIEMAEYGGYELLGEGEGMFMLGAGDFGGELGQVFTSGELGSTWIDAMQDMLVNLIGSVVGVIVIFFLKMKNML